MGRGRSGCTGWRSPPPSVAASSAREPDSACGGWAPGTRGRRPCRIGTGSRPDAARAAARRRGSRRRGVSRRLCHCGAGIGTPEERSRVGVNR